MTLLTDLLTVWLTDCLTNLLVVDGQRNYLLYCLPDRLVIDLVTD